MADEITAAGGQEPTDGGTPAAPVPAAQAPQAAPQASATPVAGQTPPATTSTEDEPFDRARAQALIDKLRPYEREAATLRKANAEQAAALKAIEDAKLSESERLSKRAAELEAQAATNARLLQERTVRYEITMAATKLGIVDPDAAAKLLDMAQLEYGEDGIPTNTDKVLKSLVKERTWLLPPATAAQPPAPAAPGIAPTNPATRNGAAGTRRYSGAELKDYTFYTANRDDIMRAHREGRIDP